MPKKLTIRSRTETKKRSSFSTMYQSLKVLLRINKRHNLSQSKLRTATMCKGSNLTNQMYLSPPFLTTNQKRKSLNRLKQTTSSTRQWTPTSLSRVQEVRQGMKSSKNRRLKPKFFRSNHKWKALSLLRKDLRCLTQSKVSLSPIR